MKIITPGRLPEEEIYRSTCRHCGCVFEFARKEAMFHHGDQREGHYLTIDCPTCNTTVHAYPPDRR